MTPSMHERDTTDEKSLLVRQYLSLRAQLWL